jgi:hypothetical protein
MNIVLVPAYITDKRSLVSADGKPEYKEHGKIRLKENGIYKVIIRLADGQQ